jgi:hypothetical protein
LQNSFSAINFFPHGELVEPRTILMQPQSDFQNPRL